MSGKIVRFVVSVMLALVVTLNATAAIAPHVAKAVNPNATLAVEHDTTAS